MKYVRILRKLLRRRSQNEELMRNVYDSMADGMTVNFPDKLVEYMKLQTGGLTHDF